MQQASKTKTIRATSPGKINLTFDIVGDLPGGYHEVVTLMQAVSIEDLLTFTFEEAPSFSATMAGVEFASIHADVPADENNLVIKAANLFHKTVGDKAVGKVSIHLRKSIPVAGGMGGGSGDAAATLVALNMWYGSPLKPEQLSSLAAQLGSDVPFFIEGGTQIGTNRGEVLQQIVNPTTFSFLIVGPSGFGLSTPEVYKAFDESGVAHKAAIDTHTCANHLQVGNKAAAIKYFANCFEPVVFAKRPELLFLYDRLNSLGGMCTRLTGSGPTMFVITDSDADASEIQHKLRDEQATGANGWDRYPDLRVHSWICASAQSGVRVLI